MISVNDLDTFECGWNLTRSELGKYQHEVGRQMHAEELFERYSKRNQEGKFLEYNKGALALIKKYDKTGELPKRKKVREVD